MVTDSLDAFTVKYRVQRVLSVYMRFNLLSAYKCECADWIKRSIKYKVTHNGTTSKLLAPSVNFKVKTYVCFAGEISKAAPSPHHSRRSASRRHGDGILPASADSKLPVSGCFRLLKFPQTKLS